MASYIGRLPLLTLACLVVAGVFAGCAGPVKPRRFGQAIQLTSDPEKVKLYMKLHAEPWPEIVGKLQECNIHNYSIYVGELTPGKQYLFAYFEYTGTDFEGDMKKMGDDPKTKEWWKLTDPCQIRIPGTPDGQQWLTLKEAYHSD